MLVLIDRARETTTVVGTGSATLLGAVLGYQTLAAVGNTNTTWYCIADVGGANWEVGVGTYSTTGPTLARTTVLASSNGGALVNFLAGTKDVFVTQPAEKVFPTDITLSGNLTANSLSLGMQSIATAGGTTTFTVASPYYTIFTGTQGQTLVLPNATTLAVGWKYGIDNDSTQAITVNANGGGAFWIIAPGCDLYITCTGIGTAAGTWEKDYSAAKAANGKSLTISNTLTLTGTDASSVAFGTGGTVLYSGGALGTPASGNLSACTGIPESNFKNIIINGGFTINQRGYVSAATLAAGAYGHDRWKAGAGGGDYSFTQLASNTTISIAANKTIIQVIEDKNVFGTTYTLSWTGTAQARYAVNSATPAGAYAASPIVITGQTVGTTMSVEFNAGTLGNVDLEPGSIATSFPTRSYSQELALCQRYFVQYYYPIFTRLPVAWCDQTTTGFMSLFLPSPMRINPTCTFPAFTVNAVAATLSAATLYANNLQCYYTGTGFTVGAGQVYNTSAGNFVFSAEF